MRGFADAAEPKLPDLFKRVAEGLQQLGPRYQQIKAMLPIDNPAKRAAYDAYVEWSGALLELYIAVGSRLRLNADVLAQAVKATGLPADQLLRIYDANNFKPVVRVVGLSGGVGILPLVLAPLLPLAIKATVAIAVSAAVAFAAWTLSAGERAKLERERRASVLVEDAINRGLGPEVAARLAKEGAPPPLPGGGPLDSLFATAGSLVKLAVGAALVWGAWTFWQKRKRAA